ncbi:MFS transporter [Lentzea sp. NPDC051213]|uniref:MFS transporter n=1 Tax=Lentzea sp. NPDC051213 TaxID=3364126 RepID=UPI0037A850AE
MRLVLGVIVSSTGLTIGQLVPIQLLLLLRVDQLTDNPAPVLGLVTGVGAAVALVLNPVVGRITDATAMRFGKRRTWLLFGALTTSLALTALGPADEVWQVVVLWSLVQALGNFQAVATSALFADQVEESKLGRVSGLNSLPMLLSPVIGLPLVGLLPPGSAQQWYLIAGVVAVAGLFAVFLIRDTPAVTRPKIPFSQTFWLSPRKHPAFAAAWLLRFLTTCSLATIALSGAFLAEKFDFTPERTTEAITQIVLLSTIIIVIVGIGSGYLTDRIRKQKPVLALSTALCAAGSMFVALVPTYELVLVGVAVQSVGIGAFLAIDFALCVRLLPNPANAGKDLAIFGLAATLPQSLVPLAAPILLPLGGFTLFYGLFAAAALAGLPALRKIPELDRIEAPAVLNHHASTVGN